MTRTDEIAPGIYRLSTFAPQGGLAFNQFLIDADEPLLFHTGMRALYPSVSEALARIVPLSRLRWIGYGHFEADECGAMNEWLADAPHATPVQGEIGCMISLGDQAARPPRALKDGEVLDLGGKRVRLLATPHVPHGWDAVVLYEETTGTLLAGDLFTALGDGPPLTHDDIVTPAIDTERRFASTALTPNTAPTIRRLADLQPTTLGLMHAPAYAGDGSAALHALADFYAESLSHYGAAMA